MVVISRCWVARVDRASATAAAHDVESRGQAALDIAPSSRGL